MLLRPRDRLNVLKKGVKHMNERPALYPLTFHPQYRHYLWGGRKLEKLGRHLPPAVPTAESWEISGHPDSPTVVDAGPLQGHPLTELMHRYGEELVGRHSQHALAKGRFPVLIKLLDAADRLSVQVHPPDTYAAAHEAGEWGKTELWYFLDAEPEARIIYGLAPGVDKEQFRRALMEGRLEKCLRFLPVRSGDAVLVPAGTVHTLLGGVLVVEIQQTSDLTYRVYDWNRVGQDGQPRPLHVEKALEVMDFGSAPPMPARPLPLDSPPGTQGELLGQCPYFVVERWVLAAGAEWTGACAGDTFAIWGLLRGSAGLEWESGRQEVVGVRFVLLPACLGAFRWRASEPAVFLRVYVPSVGIV